MIAKQPIFGPSGICLSHFGTFSTSPAGWVTNYWFIPKSIPDRELTWECHATRNTHCWCLVEFSDKYLMEASRPMPYQSGFWWAGISRSNEFQQSGFGKSGQFMLWAIRRSLGFKPEPTLLFVMAKRQGGYISLKSNKLEVFRDWKIIWNFRKYLLTEKENPYIFFSDDRNGVRKKEPC